MAKSGQVRNIADLARLAGVSPGTVSRALTDSGLVSKDTSERIKALAREHDFRPNVMARNLRIKRTGAIGVVIPLGHETGQHVSDPFFMTLLGHLADALTERGHDLLLSRIIPKRPDWLDAVVDSGRVDGVLLIGQSDQIDVIDRVSLRYLPMVVWGAYTAGQSHCSVGTDNRRGGELATAHLIERGCRRIAFFGDPLAPEIAHRLEGCRQALARVGLADSLRVLPAHLTPETAYPAIAAWLRAQDQMPDGVVAVSDIVAMSTLNALADLGLAAPADVRVVGYDDLALANQTAPPLTTIRQDLQAGAAHMVDLLLRRIGGERTQSVTLAPELIIRQSS